MIQYPNYTYKHSLGEGGMATVWLAEHNILLKPVAIKVLNKQFVHNNNIRKRFLAEARNLFGMSHPNIIKVTDLIDQDDLVAFVMEYIEGQTLKDYLDKKGKLSDEEIKQLFTQMLDAVGYVHEQGLIHRDIKPSNFMISKKGVIKLLDFGIAKNTDINSDEYTITTTSQSMGTPMYMSPEQVKSTKDVTPQSDIYSLGVVLWQMVIGKKPYDTNTLSAFELQTKIVTEPLPLTKKEWDRIIQKAVEKELSYRIRTTEEFKTAVKTYPGVSVTKLDEETQIHNTDNEKTIVEDNSPAKEPKRDSRNKFNYSLFESYFSKLSKNGSLFLGRNIPDKKLRAFTKNFKFEFISECTFFIFYDDTLFGVGSEGYAIVREGEDSWYLLMKNYKKIYTFPFSMSKTHSTYISRIEYEGGITIYTRHPKTGAKIEVSFFREADEIEALYKFLKNEIKLQS